MQCPRDGNELAAKTYEANLEIDCCPSCQGTWLDHGELETIQRTVERVRPYGMGSQIVIDVCPDGCGIWLDGGELQSLERLYEQSQAESPLPIHWRIWAGVIGAVRGKRA